tara:strand:+ start:42 stop:812 length:771 start_codon:yes stop_codon:yes gene_type:complete
MGYFNVTVVPEIAASKQHTAVFSAADNLFGWVSFEIPKGGAKLIGATMMVRPKGNASPTANEKGAFLVFATNDSQPIGTINSAPSRIPSNDFIGFVEFDDVSSYAATINSTSVAVTGRSSNDNNTHPSIVFAREDGSEGQGSSVGYDKFYMRGIANGSFDFQSINVINDADINSTTPTAIVMAGTSMDIRAHFIAGDVLHAQDDILLGTVDTITNATTGPINLTSATSGAGDATTVANGDTIYNINPIRIILHFEK